MRETAQWGNPAIQSYRDKRFFTELPGGFGGVGQVLDQASRILRSITPEKLWEPQPSILPVHGLPGSYELQASATYLVHGRKGMLTLVAVATPRPDGAPQIGLMMEFGDRFDLLPLPWQEAQSELIVAQTLLIVLDNLRSSIGYPRHTSEPPNHYWEWYQPTCGWMRSRSFEYGGWHIKLGD